MSKLKKRSSGTLAGKRHPLSFERRIFEAQTRLIYLTDKFVLIGAEDGPSQAVDQLLSNWLSNSSQILTGSIGKSQLQCALLLIELLQKLYINQRGLKMQGEEGQCHV